MYAYNSNARKNVLCAFFFCALLCLLAACDSQASTSPSIAKQATSTPHGASTSMPPVQTEAMPVTDTSCPASGTARAAIMRPLALGRDQNIVYTYNDRALSPQTVGLLKRYDTTTRQKILIVQSGLTIVNAQISTDGQWIMFLTITDAKTNQDGYNLNTKLQLVRMDGQGLQTLYCFQKFNYIYGSATDIRWSPDQKTVLFAETSYISDNVITLLDLATGNMHTELKINGRTGTDTYDLGPMLDNTHVYIIKTNHYQQALPTQLYLLDTTTNKDPNGGDLKSLLITDTIDNSVLSTSYDNKQLFTGKCDYPNSNMTISTQHVDGGPSQRISTIPNGCLNTLRLASNHSLLLLGIVTSMNSITGHIWTMNNDGSGLTNVTDLPPPYKNEVQYYLNKYTQSLWSNVSRDGSMYVLEKNNVQTQTRSLLFGSLNGGAPTEFVNLGAGTTGLSEMVGWTTM